MDILDEKIMDFMIDISEENIRNSMPEILDILLIYKCYYKNAHFREFKNVQN